MKLILVDGKLIPRQRKSYQCPLCPKQYQSGNDLRRHLKKIHGETFRKKIEEEGKENE